jgi:hypothetical protein
MTSGSADSEKLLVSVTCPRCAGDLTLNREDRIALCHPCCMAYFLDRAFRSYDLEYLAPLIPANAERIYVPFWKVEGYYSIAADSKRQRQYGHMKVLGPLFYPAFWMPRFQYFDDFTQRYALLDAPLEVEKRRDPVPGGVRNPEILPEMARLTVLAHLDRAVDVTGVDVSYEVLRISLAGVPFLRQADSWLDGICGIKVPLHLFSGR